MVEKVLQLNREKTIFWALVGILFLSIAFYMFLINTTVHNIVARKNLESKASELTLNIGRQEFAYISKKNAITLELAHEMGFEDATVKKYITEKPGTFAFLSR